MYISKQKEQKYMEQKDVTFLDKIWALLYPGLYYIL